MMLQSQVYLIPSLYRRIPRGDLKTLAWMQEHTTLAGANEKGI